MTTRKKKVTTSPNPDESNFSEEPAEPADNIVDVEIDEHVTEDKDTGGISDLLKRASKNLVETVTDEKPSKKRDRSKSRFVRKESKQEFATLVSAIITMFLAAWSVPDDLKPNDDEVGAVSMHATQLILRHVNIPGGRLSADVLDVIGLIAVTSGYFARTSAGWSQYREAHKQEPAAAQEIIYNDTPAVQDNAFPVAQAEQ